MKNLDLCFFEDQDCYNFGPLIQTRPVWSLRCGAYTLSEKIQKRLGLDNHLFVTRTTLSALYSERSGQSDFRDYRIRGDILFINGRARLSDAALDTVVNTSGTVVFSNVDGVIAIKAAPETARKIKWSDDGTIDLESLRDFDREPIEARLFKYPWELVDSAADEISNDLEIAVANDPGRRVVFPNDVTIRNIDNVRSTGNVTTGPGTIINADSPVRLGDGSVIGAGVVMEAADGPIWIDENAEIQAGAILLGPVFIGAHSIVRPGARLSDGVCLGPHCRVGGEVSKTVILGYSSKQHSGYLGTSYLGEWVNLGAATDNSDLKNNYKPVEVVINGQSINTGSLHVGVFIADFCRTAIQTRLNSGSVVGVCCNLFGPDFPEKTIPAFTWFGSDGYMEYNFSKAVETIAAIMPRRGKRLTPAMETVLESIFDNDKNARGSLTGKS